MKVLALICILLFGLSGSHPPHPSSNRSTKEDWIYVQWEPVLETLKQEDIITTPNNLEVINRRTIRIVSDRNICKIVLDKYKMGCVRYSYVKAGGILEVGYILFLSPGTLVKK